MELKTKALFNEKGDIDVQKTSYDQWEYDEFK